MADDEKIGEEAHQLDAEFLRKSFAHDQSQLSANLRSSERISHAGDRGEVNELFFIDFLRSYLPNRYTVDKAIILDSVGKVSDSIDVVVYDRQYTPTLLANDYHHYVPAEAVYAVFECKPTINATYLRYAGRKAASVRKLKRTSVSVHTVDGKREPKQHFAIVAGILAIDVSWSDGLGNAFKASHSDLTNDQVLDCGFAASGACFDTYDGELKLGPTSNALAYFAFRLLSKLQTMATVPAVDWMAYARQLSDLGSDR